MLWIFSLLVLMTGETAAKQQSTQAPPWTPSSLQRSVALALLVLLHFTPGTKQGCRSDITGKEQRALLLKKTKTERASRAPLYALIIVCHTS